MKLDELFPYDQVMTETGGVGRVVPGVNTTADVGPNEIQKQAKKWGFKVSKDGLPPKAKPNGKLDELAPYKSNNVYQNAKKTFNKPKGIFARKKSFASFAKVLKDNGFKLLGKGSFAVTFEKPGYPWVIKVFTSDNSYKHFLDYVLKHQDNPHLPKIKGKFIPINGITFAVRIEKLTPISEEHPLAKRLWDLLGNHTDKPLARANRDWLRKHYPRILEIFKDIRKTSKGHAFTYDTHDGNIMQRADGTPVITDPLYDPEIDKYD